jgi:hypothetical protein
MMGEKKIQNFKNSFSEKQIIICFVNVETDPRLRYKKNSISEIRSPFDGGKNLINLPRAHPPSPSS